jgi:alkane 1-monooxygenase
MIVLAIVPAIWRRVMDPRVLAHFGGDISRANISPRKRDRILARYGAGAATDPQDVPTGSPVTTSAGHTEAEVAAEALAWRCPGCDYTYDVVAGEEREGFAAGTAWSEIPATWCCPDCGVREKVDFVPVEPALSS